MFFQAALVDLDNTLYDYDACHRKALAAVLEAVSAGSGLPVSALSADYARISAQLKIELGHTAACHSRFIYLKQLAAMRRLPFAEVSAWHALYWRVFHAAMRPVEGACELLALLKARGVKIALLSDFQIEPQFEKLATLGLIDSFDEIVTSEEIGVEKPNSKMFLAALAKIGATADRTVMIGDNFAKDIAGAAACGIHGFWIDPTRPTVSLEPGYARFPDVAALYAWLRDLDGALDTLERLSRDCGGRFDLTQAAGGNTSVKFGDCLCVKASGLALGDVTRNAGYSVIDNALLRNDIAAGTADRVETYARFTRERASIETYMHALLRPCVAHVHPIQVNEILTGSDGAAVIAALFPDALVLDYITPGAGIAYALQARAPAPKVVFLMNHGLIVNADSAEETAALIDHVVGVCEAYSGGDYARYRDAGRLAALLNAATGLSYTCLLCEDAVIRRHLTELEAVPPLTPDLIVYCGVAALRLDALDRDATDAYLARRGPPKIVAYAGHLYIYDRSLKKCRETESVLKSLALLSAAPGDRRLLTPAEVDFISNWEAEAYRQNLKH